jgi:methanogenic corrinoid protein MtbC1
LAVLNQRMYGHLVAGEESQADRLIAALVETGVTVSAVAQDVLVPALRQIGEEWRAGHLEIAVEHRASAIVERILASHSPKPRGRRRGTAAVAALAGDRHVLPTALAAICLREDNWLVHHLGADLPSDDLLVFCRRHHVDLVVLTVTTTKLRPAANRTAEQLQRLGLRVLVGGPGRSLDELQQLARQERRQHSTADPKRPAAALSA